MIFTLVHYTEGWTEGRTVELDTMPQAGMVVHIDDQELIDQSQAEMYYVDNIMLSTATVNGQTVNYLFVRPYKNWGVRCPMTEQDRLAQSVKELGKQIAALKEGIESAAEQNRKAIEQMHSELSRQLNSLCNDMAEINELTSAIEETVNQ